MINLLITYTDGQTLITKFNGTIEEAVADYQKKNFAVKNITDLANGFLQEVSYDQ